jgi:hypothetical protein
VSVTHLEHVARDLLELALAATELARQLHLVALQPQGGPSAFSDITVLLCRCFMQRYGRGGSL